jgi:hypothetical protein
MKRNKKQMEDHRELKAEEAPIINHVNNPNQEVPTMNSNNDPSANWHLESGEKINDYDRS